MRLTFFLLILLPRLATAQYAGPVGGSGHPAVFRTDPWVTSWGDSVLVERGWVDPRDTSLGKASLGQAGLAKGQANGRVVSLGNGGVATYFFQTPLQDGSGADIAVFENSFSDSFLELAFVEISENGQDYFRFPAHSLTQDTQQVASEGLLDATKLNNLAGKFRGQYGVPFDFFELKDSLNINAVRYVRIIDVVGNIDPRYGSRDTAGNMINDPFPTPYPSAGFDLDALAVLGTSTNVNDLQDLHLEVYPNPAPSNGRVRFSEQVDRVRVLDGLGRSVLENEDVNHIMTHGLGEGLYWFHLEKDQKHTVKPLMIR